MDHKVWVAIAILYIGKSIAEICQDGQLKAVTGNCNKFRLCRERQWNELTCSPPHQVFDSLQGKCVSTSSYCSSERRSTDDNCTRDLCKQNVRCIDGQTKTLGCKEYSKCISGEWVQVECKKDETVIEGRCTERICSYTPISCREYIINGEHIYCENGYHFDKILFKCTPGFCETHACKEGEVKKVDGTCKNYQECSGGVFVDKQCRQCQNFDEDKGKCVFIWDKPCGGGSTTTDPSPTTTDSPSTTSETSSATTPTDHPTKSTTAPPPKCSSGQRKPDYENCNYYYECDEQGNWKNKSCWWFFFFKFDVDTYKCKFWSAKCARK